MSTLVRASRRRALLRSEVENELESLFSRYVVMAQGYGAEFTRLWSLAASHVQGGKLLRPLLLLEVHDALSRAQNGGLALSEPREDSEDRAGDRAEVLRIATAVEVLHFAFLLHDDVIDQDTSRRGRRNLIGELAGTVGEGPRGRRPQHWAESGGILAGDLLISAAHQLFARVNVPDDVHRRLLDLLEHTIMETTAGEFADVGLGDGVIVPDLNSVLAMTTRKTATYTFELPLRAAVILAGGSQELESALSVAGSHLGLAYQLQDDLLSTFGNAAMHGKDPLSDLREGKQTAIVCYARMTSAWPSIEGLFGDAELSEENAAHLRSMLSECGAEQFVRGLIEEQLAAFSEVLAGGSEAESIPTEIGAVLLDLVSQLEGRES